MEFEMRKEGREYYLPLYGHLAKLTDLVVGYVRALETRKAQIIVDKGYKYLDSNEIINQYNQAYEDFSTFLGQSRKKGYELFLPLELSHSMEEILGYSTFFHEEKKWDLKNAQRFAMQTDSVMKRMEELLGVKRISLEERLSKVKRWLDLKAKKWLDS